MQYRIQIQTSMQLQYYADVLARHIYIISIEHSSLSLSIPLELEPIPIFTRDAL
jgi:hypothetical protein